MNTSTLVLLLAGVPTAAVSGFFAYRQAMKSTAVAATAEQNANQIAGVKMQMEGWQAINLALREDNERLHRQLADERAAHELELDEERKVNTALSKQNESLHAQLRRKT
jgi:predicted  nucleic acid-binding Zn-ribbon protein